MSDPFQFDPRDFGNSFPSLFWEPYSASDTAVLFLSRETVSRTVGQTIQTLEALNSIFAILVAIDTNRTDELHALLTDDANTNLDSLLGEDEKLELIGVMNGSWWGTFTAKTKSAYNAISAIAMTASTEGKDIWIERERIKNRKAAAEADKAEAEADKARADAKKADYEKQKVAFEHFKSLHDYYQKDILPLPNDNPIRIRFEHEISRLNPVIEDKLAITDQREKK